MAASLHVRRLHAAVNYWQGDDVTQVVDPFVDRARGRVDLVNVREDIAFEPDVDAAVVKEIVRVKKSQACANAVRGSHLASPIVGRRVVLQCNSWLGDTPMCLSTSRNTPDVKITATALPIPAAPPSPGTPQHSFRTWADDPVGDASFGGIPRADSSFIVSSDGRAGSGVAGSPDHVPLTGTPLQANSVLGSISGLKRPASAAVGSNGELLLADVKRPASAAPTVPVLPGGGTAPASQTATPAPVGSVRFGGGGVPRSETITTKASFTYPLSTHPSSATMVKELEVLDGSDTIPDRCMWVIQVATDPRRRKSSANPELPATHPQRPTDPDAETLTYLLQSYERRGEYLCLKEGGCIGVSRVGVYPQTAYEFVFVETLSGMFMMLPKAMKGCAVRGWADTGEVVLYQFRSGRKGCPWRVGLGGGVDDFLTPNTCEWAVTSVTSSSGITVGAPLGKLPRELRGTKEKTVSVYLKSLHGNVYLSCKDGQKLCTATECSPFEMFAFNTPDTDEMYFTVTSQQFTHYSTQLKLLPATPAAVPGKSPPPEGVQAYVLATPDLAYVSIVKKRIRAIPEYNAGSLWTMHAYVLDSYEYLSGVQRRVVGLFPGMTPAPRAAKAASYRENIARVAKQRSKRAAEAKAKQAQDAAAVQALKAHMSGFATRLPKLYSAPGYIPMVELPDYAVTVALLCVVVADRGARHRRAVTHGARAAAVGAALVTASMRTIVTDEVALMETHLEELLARLEKQPPGYLPDPLTHFRNPLRAPSISEIAIDL